MTFTLNMLAISCSFLLLIPMIWQSDWIYQTLFHRSELNVQILMYFIFGQIPLQFLFMNYTYLLIYKEDVKTYNRALVIKGLSFSVISIILLFLFDMGLSSVVIAAIGSSAAALLYSIHKFQPQERRTRVFPLSLIKDMFHMPSNIYWRDH